MKLIVGLGNPGKRYEKTRHNLGFMALDYYAQKHNLEFKPKFDGLFCETKINNEKIIFLKPQTYMNLSGNCIIKYVKYYNIEINNILVIYDDYNYDVGIYKIKRGGSSGGHNGLKSIIENIKSENFARIKIGISKNTIPLEDYVLQKLSNDEINKIKFTEISNVINDFFVYDIDYLMCKYNGNQYEK